MAKGKPAQSLEEAAKLMQMDSTVIPADADPSASTVATKKPAETPAPDQSVVQTVEAKVTEQESETETAETEEEKPKEISEEEKKRRSFQAENEQLKAQMAKIQADQNLIVQNLEVEKAKSNALMNMLAGTQALRGGEQAEPKKAKPKAEKEPELWDFIKPDDYDREDALDPRTASGQAWAKYNRAIQRFESAQVYKQQQAEAQEANARELTLKNAKDLAEAYPEFKNVLTGQPDFDKIQDWLDSLSKTSWVSLKRSLDGKVAAPAVNGNGHEAPAPKAAEAEIARRASKPASVATQSSTVETPAKKFSPEVENLHKLFGGSISLPVDAT